MQTEIQKILFKHLSIYCESDLIVEQVAQKGSEVSVLGCAQNITEQPTLPDPALSRKVELDYLLRSLPTSSM